MGQGTVNIAPCTVKAATAQVRVWHRHLPEVQGGLFAVRAMNDQDECVGVGIAGNPARVWQGTGRVVISRVATSLRAAGFEDMGLSAGGEHSRPSRLRAPAVRPEPKRRWMRRLAA